MAQIAERARDRMRVEVELGHCEDKLGYITVVETRPDFLGRALHFGDKASTKNLRRAPACVGTPEASSTHVCSSVLPIGFTGIQRG